MRGIDFATATRRRRKIVGEVKSRIAELRRRGIKFAICWWRMATTRKLRTRVMTTEGEMFTRRLSEHPKELFDMLVE